MSDDTYIVFRVHRLLFVAILVVLIFGLAFGLAALFPDHKLSQEGKTLIYSIQSLKNWRTAESKNSDKLLLANDKSGLFVNSEGKVFDWSESGSAVIESFAKDERFIKTAYDAAIRRLEENKVSNPPYGITNKSRPSEPCADAIQKLIKSMEGVDHWRLGRSPYTQDCIVNESSGLLVYRKGEVHTWDTDGKAKTIKLDSFDEKSDLIRKTFAKTHEMLLVKSIK